MSIKQGLPGGTPTPADQSPSGTQAPIGQPMSGKVSEQFNGAPPQVGGSGGQGS